MSDTQPAPDWWQASDGKWYPPQNATLPQPTPNRTSQDMAIDQAKGFLRSLFDFKLQSFVTLAVLRFLYLVAVIIIALGAGLALLVAFASKSVGLILLSIVFVPVFFLLYVIFTRMYFELVAAFFQIADDIRAVRRQGDA